MSNGTLFEDYFCSFFNSCFSSSLSSLYLFFFWLISVSYFEFCCGLYTSPFSISDDKFKPCLRLFCLVFFSSSQQSAILKEYPFYLNQITLSYSGCILRWWYLFLSWFYSNTYYCWKVSFFARSNHFGCHLTFFKTHFICTVPKTVRHRNPSFL